MAVEKNIEEKPFFFIVFVVLVYRNTDVLKGFFESLSLPFSYKVIIVNNFYDVASERDCRLIAEENNADFMSIPNKGYGTGNNVGCRYAMDHYQYHFMALSNSDIIIQDLSILSKLNLQRAVFAPDTRMENGHRQNPHIPIRLSLYMKLLDLSYHYKSELLMTIAFALNRFFRELLFAWTKLTGKTMIKVFSAHGSFIVFSSQAVRELMPLFNEEMFLYNEELYLAHRCKQEEVPVYYVPELRVKHLEGASSTVASNGWKNHEDSYRVLADWLKEYHFL